jgi:Dolichyl-phosphate-mannose-protein mannosyltransferase
MAGDVREIGLRTALRRRRRRVDARGERLHRWIASHAGWRAALLLFAIYVGAHFALRDLTRGAIPFDDAWENVVAQNLQLGYQLGQPPLYQWLLWPLQRLVGPSLLSFLLLRYGLVFLLLVLHYALSRRAFGSAAAGLMATGSLALYVFFAYTNHEWHTHLEALMVAALGVFLAYGRLCARRDWAGFLLLGLAAGAMLLAKFESWPMFLFLALAALAHRDTRSVLRDPRMLIVLAVAGAMFAPYLYWAVGTGADPFVRNVRAFSGSAEPWLPAALSGLRDLVRETATFFAIGGFLVPALLLARRERLGTAPVGGDPALRGLLARYVAIAVALALAAALVGYAPVFKTRYVVALYLPAPLLLYGLVLRSPARRRLQARLAVWIPAMLVLAFLVRLGNFAAPWPPFCDARCWWAEPFDRLASRLAEPALAGGTVVADHFVTAGNLRAYFPDARYRALTRSEDFHTALTAATGGACIFIWRFDPRHPTDFEAIARRAPGLEPDDRLPGRSERSIEVPWRALIPTADPRTTIWKIVDLRPDAPICR